MTTPDIAAPATDIAAPATGPACAACGVTASPTVWLGHWQRRLRPDEIAAEQATEQARRDQALRLADPQLPPPVFGPLPDCLDYTRAVHGCINHAITADAAALVHQAACTAPDPALLPGCNCTPEAPPQPDPEPETPPSPPGW